jgi:hypothetical protein
MMIVLRAMIMAICVNILAITGTIGEYNVMGNKQGVDGELRERRNIWARELTIAAQ